MRILWLLIFLSINIVQLNAQVDSLLIDLNTELDSVEKKISSRSQIREIRGRILDMQTVRREYRDSISHIHHEIGDYRDT